MRYIRDKPARSMYTGDTSLRRFEWLCRHCGSHLKAQIEAARASLRFNIPWRNCNVLKTANHKYNIHMDDIYCYEFGFVGESSRCSRNCARRDSGHPVGEDDDTNSNNDQYTDMGDTEIDEEDADTHSDNNMKAEMGDAEDEASSMHDRTGSHGSRGSTRPSTVSSTDPVDADTSYCGNSDSLDLATLDRQRHLSSSFFKEHVHLAETPQWDSLSLASSSSDDSLSVLSSDSTVSGCTAYEEDAPSNEDDSRICPRRCLDLENNEDCSIDGNGKLWPNEILRRVAVILTGEAEPQRR
ncbi:uncharacterized protein Z520_04738 [Fonsecaea multimorphosa CBS 102226]|uniref:Uncharacterized protein n=1 Tax=Fonsecaea multimorphosa CBS 102226 TaxID=1442371 RepID=A0A0D2K034_9EURO|nr:uncharacterized protein Z520_04738 [Fonsecaea multimorphosa CBS 102226]KIX99162.1 hypothetical protein Z520_04738 [Fonsecaea multimorphosa CBS 102226]OAL26073.1 hypothetical protein AYO22_04487 [Fonsecaea multimorphosa]